MWLLPRGRENTLWSVCVHTGFSDESTLPSANWGVSGLITTTMTEGICEPLRHRLSIYQDSSGRTTDQNQPFCKVLLSLQDNIPDNQGPDKVTCKGANYLVLQSTEEILSRLVHPVFLLYRAIPLVPQFLSKAKFLKCKQSVNNLDLFFFFLVVRHPFRCSEVTVSQCSGITPDSARKIIWDARDQT